MGDFINDLANQCPPETPLRFLRFTWFGDFACSSGDHYKPGTARTFENILATVNKEHSDDLVENLACWIIREQTPAEPSLVEWRALCSKFYHLIEGDYRDHTIRYSPDYPTLFSVQSDAEYLWVITHHTNCGGAMRSASLAYGGATAAQHLTLVGLTHLYPDSLAGAFAIFDAVKALKDGGGPQHMWEAAQEAAVEWDQKARQIIQAWGGSPEPSGLLEQIQAVKKFNSPAYGINDWFAQGITTRFVIPAAMAIAAQAIPLGAKGALRRVVEQGIAIGGDPDTLGSIGMALVGAHFGEELQAEIDEVLQTMVPPEQLDLPAFLDNKEQ